MNKEQMMNMIQSLDFAKCETALFLDTHPECKAALDYFHKISDELNLLVEEYEAKFGPLTVDGVGNDSWSWVSSPWPWQMNHGDGGQIQPRRTEAK